MRPKASFDREARYRVTRAAFDVVSVFPTLQAEAVPGPVFAAVLALHGYSESAVRNRLVRMVDQEQLVRESRGTTSLYRVAPALQRRLGEVRQGAVPPAWQGRFHALVFSIPESSRSLRDRVVYVARYHGYRQLRPGVFLAFDDHTEGLLSRLEPLLTADGHALSEWAETCWMTPGNEAVARNWARRAFVADGMDEHICRLEARAQALPDGPPATFLPPYMDLLYDAMVSLHDVAPLPREFADLSDAGERIGALFRDLHLRYAQTAGGDVLEHALAVPAARHIEFVPGFDPEGEELPV